VGRGKRLRNSRLQYSENGTELLLHRYVGVSERCLSDVSVFRSSKELELGLRCGNINILVEFDYRIWKGLAPAPSISAHPVGIRQA
jgi:hypothetical protein